MKTKPNRIDKCIVFDIFVTKQGKTGPQEALCMFTRKGNFSVSPCREAGGGNWVGCCELFD